MPDYKGATPRFGRNEKRGGTWHAPFVYRLGRQIFIL